jgi:glycosyltransferase involved in cell wall biosynthesis
MNINFTGPINDLGFGVTGLNLLLQFHNKCKHVAYFPIGQTQAQPEYHGVIQACLQNRNNFDPDAPSLRLWHQHDMAQHVGRGLHIGFPIFELNRFNEIEFHHLRSLDKIVVCSNWARQVIRDTGVGDAIVAPLGVDRSIFHEGLCTPVNKNSKTVFFNCGKWEVRKGHDILVEAFNKAFTTNDDVELIMNCYNPFYTEVENAAWINLYKNSRLGNKISVNLGRLANQKQLASLMATIDCGIFPAKAEGWNLEILELMSIGKHIITTNYSGHTEFCNVENSLLIEPNTLEPAYDGKWFFGQGEWMKFGNNQLDQLITHMRQIHKMKQEGSLNVNDKGILTAKHLTWANTVDHMLQGIS